MLRVCFSALYSLKRRQRRTFAGNEDGPQVTNLPEPRRVCCYYFAISPSSCKALQDLFRCMMHQVQGLKWFAIDTQQTQLDDQSCEGGVMRLLHAITLRNLADLVDTFKRPVVDQVLTARDRVNAGWLTVHDSCWYIAGIAFAAQHLQGSIKLP